MVSDAVSSCALFEFVELAPGDDSSVRGSVNDSIRIHNLKSPLICMLNDSASRRV